MVQRTKKHSGFTMVEILLVVAIITILMTIMVKVSRSVRLNSQIKTTKANMQLLVSALQEYKDYKKVYPSGGMSNAFRTMYAIPKCREILNRIPAKYRDTTTVYDAWKKPLSYSYDNTSGNFPVIISAGPDKKLNNADDIRSDEL